MSTEYVLGFVFNQHDEVLLMWKGKPVFQAGRLNGIGGKIENGETPFEAMERETREEVSTSHDIRWKPAGEFFGRDWRVSVFCAYHNYAIESKEAERVQWFDSQAIPRRCIYNLRWLVPLCRFQSRYGHILFSVDERDAMEQAAQDKQDESDRLDAVSR
jgi:8-oxo-dGTP diphosphatase